MTKKRRVRQRRLDRAQIVDNLSHVVSGACAAPLARCLSVCMCSRRGRFALALARTLRAAHFALCLCNTITTTQNFDLLNPDTKEEAIKHKLKRLVQAPNSFFMDVRCPGALPPPARFSRVYR